MIGIQNKRLVLASVIPLVVIFMLIGSFTIDIFGWPNAVNENSSPLSPEDSLIINGNGWGHSLGLCQYGAYGLAGKNKNYREILQYYYTGSSIGRIRNPAVNVRLAKDESVVKFTATGPFLVKDGKTGNPIAHASPRQIWTVSSSGQGNLLLKNPSDNVVSSVRGSIKFAPADDESLLKFINDEHVYRGFLVAVPTGNQSVKVVNRVLLEDYVRGISEVPSDWPAEALRAQAIAARTYAFTRAKRELLPDQWDQVYIGYNQESGWMGDRWVKAVTDTTGQVITHRGEPIFGAYYHSTCGGWTENSENVWSEAISYLREKKCEYCSSSPKYRWEKRYKVSEIIKILNSDPATRIDGELVRISVQSRRGPRQVGSVTIIGTNGRRDVIGSEMRRVLELNSTWFDIKSQRNKK